MTAKRATKKPAEKETAPVKMLTREEILGANDIRRERVEVPEWGGSVLVQGMNGTARDMIEAKFFSPAAKNLPETERYANLRATTVGLSVIHENGTAMFTMGDVAALGRKSAVALDRVFQVAQSLSGITPELIEELVGNSEAGQSEGSTSG